MPSNLLYLAVLPLVHITPTQFTGYGLTEQVITVFSGRDMATAFFPNEVDTFIDIFKTRAEKYLTSGNVTRWEFFKEDSGDGRYLVRVIQHVG